jgi:hypothetical protein
LGYSSFSQLSAAAPYIEVIFADQAGDMVRGYLEGTIGYDSSNNVNSFTLVDFGLAPEAGTVPEPGSLALLAAGAAGIGALRRRRRAASAV